MATKGMSDEEAANLKTPRADFKKWQEQVVLKADKEPGALRYELASDEGCLAFDAKYKSYVEHVLETKHGFKRKEGRLLNHGIDAEDIYHDVLVKLLGGALVRFDFDAPNVGKGGFRNYLKLMIATAFADAKKPELVPAYDENGKPIMEEKVVLKNRRPVLDENGNPVVKMVQKRVPRPSVGDHIENFTTKKPGVTPGGVSRGEEWSTACIAKLRYDLMLLAYLKLTDEMAANAKGWGYPAMVRLYEEMVDDRVVCRQLIESGQISGVGNFYTAKSRFLDAWKDVERKVEEQIFDRRNKEMEKDGKKCRKGDFSWTPKVSYDAALKMVRTWAKEVRDQVGKKRFATVHENFKFIMQRLVLESDARTAEKNAWKYK